jgi:small neutral amino acid transporter SnatA (MarC family)
MVDTFLLAKSFVTLLVITDPVGTVPIFLAIAAEWGAASATGPPGRRSSWPP